MEVVNCVLLVVVLVLVVMYCVKRENYQNNSPASLQNVLGVYNSNTLNEEMGWTEPSQDEKIKIFEEACGEGGWLDGLEGDEYKQALNHVSELTGRSKLECDQEANNDFGF
jgi:hypothetical protein